MKRRKKKKEEKEKEEEKEGLLSTQKPSKVLQEGNISFVFGTHCILLDKVSQTIINMDTIKEVKEPFLKVIRKVL